MGGSNSKEKEAASNLQEAQKQAAAIQAAAATQAQQNITAVGQPTAAETTRQAGYTAKANAPAESLMTQAGPISQAVASRIQERVSNPGMDYDVSSINKSIGNPIWAGLKARGIAAQPGDTTGGGLGTEQYMQQMVPYLAAGKEAQVNTDISRGQDYGTAANALQQLYVNLENSLSEAMRGRQVQTTMGAAPYGTAAAGYTAGGLTQPAETGLAEQQRLYGINASNNAAIGQGLASILAAALAVPTGGASLAIPAAVSGATKLAGSQGGGTPYDARLSAILARK